MVKRLTREEKKPIEINQLRKFGKKEDYLMRIVGIEKDDDIPVYVRAEVLNTPEKEKHLIGNTVTLLYREALKGFV